MEQYNPYNYDESFAQEYGGFGEGGGGDAAGVIPGMPPRSAGGPRAGQERELKIPTLVRDVPRPLSPPRNRYRDASYDRELPPSLMGVAAPNRGPPGSVFQHYQVYFPLFFYFLSPSFLLFIRFFFFFFLALSVFEGLSGLFRVFTCRIF